MLKLQGKWLQYTAAISASLLTAAGGMSVMWPSPVLPQLIKGDLQTGIKITENEASLVASLLMMGSVFGNIILGPSIDYFGRKRTLLIAAIPMFICWILLIFAKSVITIYVARFVMGFFQSAPMAVTSLYIGEIAEAKIRGKLSLISVLILEGASVLTIIIGSFVSYITLTAIASALPVLFFVSFYFMPESPYFYIKLNNFEKAKYSLQKFRDSEDVTEEMTKIKTIIGDNDGNNSLVDLFRLKKYRYGLFVVLGSIFFGINVLEVIRLKTLQQCSGNIAIQSYMKIIFQKADNGMDADTSSMISVSVALPSILLASYLIDRVGRKLLYYISTLGTMCALILESIYFYMQSTPNVNMSAVSWLPVAGIFSFFVFRALAITSIANLVLGELFPPHIKGSATSVTLVYASTLASAVSYGFPGFSDYFGLGTSFLTFAVICFAGFWFVLFCVPETKGRMLADLK